MKHYLKLYAYIYAITSLITFLLALGIMRIYDITLQIRPLFWGSILISLCLALSIKVFKKTWGNGVLNVILGYLIILPAIFTLRLMYGTVLFRRTIALYLIGLVYAIVYSLIVLNASLKNKKEESKLNQLLKDQEEKPEE